MSKMTKTSKQGKKISNLDFKAPLYRKGILDHTETLIDRRCVKEIETFLIKDILHVCSYEYEHIYAQYTSVL